LQQQASVTATATAGATVATRVQDWPQPPGNSVAATAAEASQWPQGPNEVVVAAGLPVHATQSWQLGQAGDATAAEVAAMSTAEARPQECWALLAVAPAEPEDIATAIVATVPSTDPAAQAAVSTADTRPQSAVAAQSEDAEGVGETEQWQRLDLERQCQPQPRQNESTWGEDEKYVLEDLQELLELQELQEWWAKYGQEEALDASAEVTGLHRAPAVG